MDIRDDLHAARKLSKYGHRHEAIAAYQSMLAANPDDVDALLALADIRLKQQLPEEASLLLTRALAVAPEQARVHILCSTWQQKLDCPAEALEYAERAWGLDPGSAPAAYALASVLARLGRFTEAIPAFERTLEIKPDWTDARTELLSAKRFAASGAPSAQSKRAKWPKQATNFENAESLIRKFVLEDSRPKTPLLSKHTKVATLGSCFAANVARRLERLKVDVFFKPIGEDINNSYANRFLLDWIVDGVETEMSADLESIYGADQRESFGEHFRAAKLFIFTLGVAPAFFDRSTGAFVLAHGGLIEARHLPEICEFRTTSVAENVANLQHVIRRIRELSSEAEIVLTVSPVPLASTYEMGSAVIADSLSKSVLRVTVEEVMRSGTPGLHYWPSYEIVRWLGPNLAAHHPPVYGAEDGNTRHVSQWMINLIMRLFIEYFGDESFAVRTPS